MKLLCIDGNSIINRAFYGIRILSTKSGIFTNGIYGFVNILNHLIEAEKPDGVVVAFDLKAKTFRHKKYDGYKAGRKPTPPELLMQMPLLKELLKYLGHTPIECEGYEADDILGTLAFECEKRGVECVISTGDRDSLQLISEKTKVLLAATKNGRPEVLTMDVAAIKEKYGIEPKGLIELKALMGDTSDKIPGVSGVGEKTALNLVQKFGTLENLYENIDSEDIKESLRQKLIADKEMAYLSRFLGTICLNAPINLDLESYKQKEIDRENLIPLLQKLEFFKMLEKIGGENPALQKNEQAFSFKKATDDILGEVFVCKTEDGIAIANEEYFKTITEEEFINLINLRADDVICHNSKELYHILLNNKIQPDVFKFDTILAGYLLNPSASSYDIEKLYSGYISASINADATEAELLAIKGFMLYKKLLEELTKTGEDKLFFEIEMPLSLVLADMEHEGFMLDLKGLKEEGEELAKKLEVLEQEIYTLAGEEFNINSPKQLGVILFEKLMLPCKKKTKSGYSTNAEVLEGLKDAHEIIPKILEYRTLAKLKATYCDGLQKAADDDGVVHTTFNQTEARTGRISSLEPNLQNIPVRRPEGKKLRKYFIAREGKLLLDADYSQIELRVLAAIANDKPMIKAFKENVDIHTLTASEVFNLPPLFITPELRSKAKAVNFGIVYGIGAFSLSKDIGTSVAEAKEMINGYFKTYPGVAKYMEEIVLKAKEDGFVTTIFGRRRYLPEITASNGMLRAFGERVARNMPIQGTAADIIKIAMIRVYNRLKEEKLNAKLILQVHDELIVEASLEDKDKAARILEREMKNAVNLAVEMSTEVKCGATWLEAKA